MPVFIKPARVVVDEGGSPLAGIVLLATAGAAALSGVLAALVHILVLILVTAGILAAGGTAWIVHVLRRDGLRMWHPPAPPADPMPPVRLVASRPAPPIPAPSPPSIETTRLLRGEPAQPHLTPEERA